MNTTPICPSCGKLLEPGAPKGLCPECLMKGAFATGTETGGNSRRFVPPSVDELAPHFPQLEILGLIGQGGMGAVYQARQKQLDRIVALKILPPQVGASEGFAERFAREARALAKLNHPHIVTLYEFGQNDGQYYFLMEFVDGINLRQLLNAGRIAPNEALAIVPQICEALQFAHERGVVHRDIKPENILLNKGGLVKIADFGVAKIVAQSPPETPPAAAPGAPPGELTGAGGVLGTPQYMAPEQVAHPLEVDHRADIYSLGVVFYQMLTGELPGKKIEPPSRKVQVDVRLDEVVLRALEKSPELRFQQASALKTQVETIAMTAGSQTPGAGAADKSSRPVPPVMGGWPGVVARLAMAFTGSAAMLGAISCFFWRNPQGVLIIAVLVGALLGIFLSILAWQNPVGKKAFTAGCVNLAIWLAVFAVVLKQGYNRTLQHAHFQQAQTLSQWGWQRWKEGDATHAAVFFQEAISQTPNNPDVWNGLGWANFSSGNYSEATKAFEKAVNLQPNHPAALNGLGQTYFALHQFEPAEKYLLQAAPSASAAWWGLAKLYLLQGKYDEAAKYIRNIIDSGEADQYTGKMLEAATSRHLSEGLRAVIEPIPPATNSPVSPGSAKITADQATYDQNRGTITFSGNVVAVRSNVPNAVAFDFGREMGLLSAWMELEAFLPNQYWNLSVYTNHDCQLFNRDYVGPARASVTLCIDPSNQLKIMQSWDRKPDSNALASIEADLQKMMAAARAFFEMIKTDSPVAYTAIKRVSKSKNPAPADYTNALALVGAVSAQTIPFYITLKQRDVKLAQVVAPALQKQLHNYNELMHGTTFEIPGLRDWDKICAAVKAGDFAQAEQLSEAAGQNNANSTDLNELAARLREQIENPKSNP